MLLSLPVHAEEGLCKVLVTAPKPIQELLEKHLRIIQWRDNPRMTSAEWQRLYTAAPQNIRDLLVTEGYFSPEINATIEQQNKASLAKFVVNPGPLP